MTPRELRDEIAVATATRRAETVRDLSLAWHVANFGVAAYVGKLPDLSDVLRRVTTTASRLTAAHRKTQVQMVGEWWGVGTKPISEEAKRALLKLSTES